MPYASRRQARWAHATGQRFAKRWDKLTDFDALPEKKDSGTSGMAIPPTGNNALFNQPGVGRVSNRRKNKKIKDCDCGCMAVEKAVSSDTPVGAPAKKPTAPAGPAAAKPAGAGQPGELLSPGVRRIRGNLCNVHGKYGPCDGKAAQAKPKKGRGAGGGKGKVPPKPKKTDEQRAADRQAAHDKRTQAQSDKIDANRSAVYDKLGVSDTSIDAINALESGNTPTNAAELVAQGLAETGADGAIRMTASGREFLNAADRGDSGAARDAASRARDQVAKRGEQEATRQSAAAKKLAAQAEREAAKKKRDEERAAKKPGKGGSSANEPDKAPGKLAQRRAGRASASGGGGGGAGSTSISPGKKPEEPKEPEKVEPEKPKIAPALVEAATAMSEGSEMTMDQLRALIRNGLARIDRDGMPVLTAAGLNATKKDARPLSYLARRKEQTAQQRAMFANMGGGGSGGGGRTEDAISLGLRQKAETYGGIKRSNLDDSVFAGPDRSFPIKTAQDVKDAVMSLGRTKHDKAAVKRGIIRRARAIGALDALPEDWKTEKAQTAEQRAMFANMGSSGGGGGGGAGGKPSGGTGGLYKKGPSGKRTPQAGKEKPGGGGSAKPTDAKSADVKPKVRVSGDLAAEAKFRESKLRAQQDKLNTKIDATKKKRERLDALHAEVSKGGISTARLREISRELASLKKQKEDASIFAVCKDDNGADRWLAITTTAYEDKDREIISRNAIKEAVALGDSTGKRGPLLFWHVSGLAMGECDFQAQGGPGDRFLIEGGTFRNKAMASLGQKLSDAGYQMSPGFIHTDDQPSNGVYDHILIYERSAVPANRAANYFTRYSAAKEDRKVLAPEKIAEYREKAAGNAEALAMLDSLLATAQKDDDTAQARNVVYKEAPEEITIGGVVYTVKAFPPAAPVEGSPEEEAAEPEAEAIAEGDMEAEQSDDGMGDGMDDAAFAQLIAKTVVAAIVQELGPHLDMSAKMSEMKDIVAGYAKKKDDEAAAQATAQAQEVATLKAKVDELTGDLPTSVMNGARNYYRASESIATQLTPQAAATVKEAISNIPAGLTDPNEIAAYKLIFG